MFEEIMRCTKDGGNNYRLGFGFEDNYAVVVPRRHFSFSHFSSFHLFIFFSSPLQWGKDQILSYQNLASRYYVCIGDL